MSSSVPEELPPGLDLIRTTEQFDQTHHPAGLLRAHRVADGLWARLVVRSGRLRFVFDDDPARPVELAAGGSVAIPAGREHHVVIGPPVTFALEFYRAPERASPVTGTESTGLS